MKLFKQAINNFDFVAVTDIVKPLLLRIRRLNALIGGRNNRRDSGDHADAEQ